MALTAVLTTTQTTSEVFQANGQAIYALLDTFTGDTPWELQVLTPAGNWISASRATQFNADGVWVADTYPAATLRFTGGDAGAQIWVEGAYI